MDIRVKRSIAVRVIAPIGFAMLGIVASGACAVHAAPSDGFELSYFHIDKPEQAYAIGLKNGLKATFNFSTGTATLYAPDGRSTTVALGSAFLAANDGNARSADEMYLDMYSKLKAHMRTQLSRRSDRPPTA